MPEINLYNLDCMDKERRLPNGASQSTNISPIKSSL